MKGWEEVLKKLKFSGRKDTRVLLEGILTKPGRATCQGVQGRELHFVFFCLFFKWHLTTLPCGPLDCWLSHAFFRDQNCQLSHWGDGLVWNPHKNWQTKNFFYKGFIALLQFFTYLKCWLIVFVIDLDGFCWLEFGDSQGVFWYFLWKCIWDECCSSSGDYRAAVSRWRSLGVHWSWISVMFPQGAVNWSTTFSVILEGILYEVTFPWIEQCGTHLSGVSTVNFSRRLICFPQSSLLTKR